MTLTEFLLARITEDEAVARDDQCRDPWIETGPADGVYFIGSDDRGGTYLATTPDRVLAECEAKRRIVELHPIYRGSRIQPVSTDGVDFGCEQCHALDRVHSDSLIEALGYCETLLALAVPYADHADYREVWGTR